MGKRSNGEGSWTKVTIKNTNYYSFRIHINGKRHNFYGKTKKEALEKFKNYKSSLVVESDLQSLTFFDYTHKWLVEFKVNKIKPRTYDYYDFITESFIKNTTLGNTTIKKLNSLSPKDHRRMFESHINQYIDKSKSTLDGLYTVLRQVCKYGVEYQDFTRNFMDGVDKVSEKEVKTKKKKVVAFEYDEVMKLWDEMLRKNEEENIVNGKVGNYVYGIGAYALLFCCFTGLRWGEVSVLKWEDIKEKDGRKYFKVDKQYITVKVRDPESPQSYKTIVAEPKSKKSNRYIPLSDKAVELLDMVKERFPGCYTPDHLIFSRTNNPYNASTANRLLKVMCIRAGLPPISPHALRHSFASILLNEDEKNLYAVSDLLGHSSSDVTYKRYIDIFERSKINTVNIFDNIKKKK